jgi:hypothetical protein
MFLFSVSSFFRTYHCFASVIRFPALSSVQLETPTRRQQAQRLRRHKERLYGIIKSPASNDHSQRRRRNRECAVQSSQRPVGRRPYFEPFPLLCFGPMNVTCPNCKALHWLAERLKASPSSTPIFTRCCHQGQVVLGRLPQPPAAFTRLYTDSSTHA